jgi:hypothetical protein
MRIVSRTVRAGGITNALVCLAFLLVAGCTTIQPARVSDFGQGVSSVKLQLDTNFADINKMVTEDEIDRAITLSTLNEENFVVVLKRDDIAKWDTALSAIANYVANLTLLLSPDNAKGFGNASEKLGTELNHLGATVPTGVAAGFAELGRLLIEAKAETDALAAARKADPGIQQIFSAMAEEIGENNGKGIRRTVWQHWLLRMGDEVKPFLSAKGNPDARRQVVLAYLDLRDKRDAQDLQLGSLHQSLLDLAAAHAALARGSNVDLAAAIGRVQQELDATRALSDFFKSQTPPTKPNG